MPGKTTDQFFRFERVGAIEQDADMVMFLYRDDYYNEDGEKNITEVIIAKHRNGSWYY